MSSEIGDPEELRALDPSEALTLRLIPIEQAVPHEEVDEKRVARLMERLRSDTHLVNPPIAARWRDRYVVLDGATRVTAMQRLDFPHIIVQVVDPSTEGFRLRTWNHVISDGRSQPRSLDELLETLGTIEGLRFERLPRTEVADALQRPEALCVFTGREGKSVLSSALEGTDLLSLMNALVGGYNEWGNVERTLLSDLPHLLGQFPRMVAATTFREFALSQVFDATARGEHLPAGVTRFVIPGRILHLNAELERLKADEPLATKRVWFETFLADKLARSRVRYYQEPVILLDE